MFEGFFFGLVLDMIQVKEKWIHKFSEEFKCRLIIYSSLLTYWLVQGGPLPTSEFPNDLNGHL